MKILLPNKKYINSPEKNVNKSIKLENTFIDLNNDIERQEIDLGDLFQFEREKSKNYKIYGKIQFSSILNNLKINYFNKEDFFERYTKLESKNLINSFDVYLLKKSKNYLNIGDKYIYTYEVIATSDQIDFYPCSYSKNIFYEQTYFYNVKKDIDISNHFDAFNKEITSFYLYFKYKNINPNKNEKIYTKKYLLENSDITFSRIEIKNEFFNIGDIIDGELFNYPNNSFDEEIIDNQFNYIDLVYNNEDKIIFKYNPFIEIKIREYSDNLEFSNIKLKNIINIPTYAKKIDDKGNYIWRNILEYGFIDPVTDKGFDFPFLNNKHYIYNNIDLFVISDDVDNNTIKFFEDIKINSYNTDLFKINPLKIAQKC